MPIPAIEPYVTATGATTYRFRVIVNGKTLRRSGFTTKTAARETLIGLLNDRNHGQLATPTKETVGAFLERYTKTLNLQTAKGSQYYRILVPYIIPRTRNVRFKDFDGLRIGELYEDIRLNGRVRGDAPLGPQTMFHVDKALHIAMEVARKQGIIMTNPVKDCPERPKSHRREKHTWTKEQAETFVYAAIGDDLYAAYVLMLTRGLRPSEVVGLKTTDINVQANRLSIARAWVIIEGHMRLSQGKTFKSQRPIALDEVLKDILFTHMANQATHRHQMGGRWAQGEENWLFAWSDRGRAGRGRPHEAGEPYSPSVVYRRFTRLCDRLGLPHIRLYDLRHTAATLALLNDTHIKVVQEMLGHTKESTTSDAYFNVTEALHAEKGAALTAHIFSRSIPSAPPLGSPEPADQS